MLGTATGVVAITADTARDIPATGLRLRVIVPGIPAIAHRLQVIARRLTGIGLDIRATVGLPLPPFPLLELATRTVRARIRRGHALAPEIRRHYQPRALVIPRTVPVLDRRSDPEQRRARGPARTNLAAIAHQRATYLPRSRHVRTLFLARPEAARKVREETKVWPEAAATEARLAGSFAEARKSQMRNDQISRRIQLARRRSMS